MICLALYINPRYWSLKPSVRRRPLDYYGFAVEWLMFRLDFSW